jgi:hypothetical protein
MWLEKLSSGGLQPSGDQKIVLNFGNPSAVINTEMLAFDLEWRGNPLLSAQGSHPDSHDGRSATATILSAPPAA